MPEVSNLQRYLGNVMAAANRAKDLVDQILAFTQPGRRERVPVQSHLSFTPPLDEPGGIG